jgi:hypothetical protein
MNMAISAKNPTWSVALGTGQTRKRFFREIMERYAEARNASARRTAAHHLSIYSDEDLARFGWSAADIKRMRNR